MSGMRIDVADLLAHAGSRRDLGIESSFDGLVASAARIERPVRADITLERISQGIVVRGELTATWESQCSNCLRDLEHDVALHVDEMFESESVDGETYPIEGNEIDLEQLVRDNVLLELPFAPHCDEPCEPAGGASVGSDNRSEPGSNDQPNDQARDPRWDVLANLQL